MTGDMVLRSSYKRDFFKEKQLLPWIMKYTNCLSYPPSLLCNSNNYPFLNSRISANQDKVERLSANGGILIKQIISLL